MAPKRPAIAPARLAVAALALAAVVGVIAAGVALSTNDEGTAGGAAAPVEERGPVVELAGTDPVTGEQVSLEAFADKPVVVNVWASWCPGCIEEADDLRRFAEAHPEAAVVGIDFQDTAAGAKAFYREWRWTHPSIFDPAGTRTAALGLLGLPTTFFLDADHALAARVVGATDLAGFEQGLAIATRRAS